MGTSEATIGEFFFKTQAAPELQRLFGSFDYIKGNHRRRIMYVLYFQMTTNEFNLIKIPFCVKFYSKEVKTIKLKSSKLCVFQHRLHLGIVVPCEA